MEEETKLYGKRDDFTFPIVNFLFISSNIPESPAYIIYISQRYSRSFDQYSDFLKRAQQFSQNLLKQGYVGLRFKSSLQNFYGRHRDLVDRHEISLKWQRIFSFLCRSFLSSSIDSTFVGFDYLYINGEHPGSPPVFSGVRVAHLFSFLCRVMFSCFVCLRLVSCVPNFARVSWLPFLDSLTFI